MKEWDPQARGLEGRRTSRGLADYARSSGFLPGATGGQLRGSVQVKLGSGLCQAWLNKGVGSQTSGRGWLG